MITHEEADLVARLLHSWNSTISQDGVVRDLIAVNNEELYKEGRRLRGIKYFSKPTTVRFTTEKIIIDSINLYDYYIDLVLDSYYDKDNTCANYDLVISVSSVIPNPLATSTNPHPHVQMGLVCPGNGEYTLNRLLRHGDLVNVARVVDSILHTYAPRSAFRKLHAYAGLKCEDCGGASRYVCHCTARFCSACYFTCDICESRRCFRCGLSEMISLNGKVIHYCKWCTNSDTLYSLIYGFGV